jgi:hypothetical protein
MDTSHFGLMKTVFLGEGEGEREAFVLRRNWAARGKVRPFSWQLAGLLWST